MKQLVFVFLGGGIGSMLRYLVGKWLNNPNVDFPYGTFFANVIGSLLIGIILGYAAKNDGLNQEQTLFLATGFCGGFTTFSTFAYENQEFLKSGDLSSFALYSIGSFAFGILAVIGGMYLIKLI